MISDGKIWVGSAGDKKVYLYPEMANRHGLIAGASGTGKTVTLKVLVESFLDIGVPVFVADIKGDVAGLANEGDSAKIAKRAKERFGIDDFEFKGYPVCFWDIYGKKGLPVRTTIHDMGAPLLSRLMELSDVQSDVLNIIFHIAEDNDIDLFTIDNLRETIRYISENREDFTAKYGTMSAQSLGSIQRSLLVLEDLGGEAFFGEPELDITDWMDDGEPRINILHSVELAHNPTLYGTFLLWMLSKLFEKLPEEGDLDKPKFVFFFDEAHMLFSDAPKALLTKVEQVVKLIRSKGVGIYFISQSPSDIPDKVLSQLSNRIQHGLRAYTPAEQKAVKAAAQAFRANPEFKTEEAILDLGVGEALISCLDEDGRPSIVQRAFIVPPRSFLGALSDAEYKEVIKGSPLYRKYIDTSDNSNTDGRIAKLEKSKAKESSKAEKESSKKTSSSKSTSSSKKSSSTKTAAKKTAGKAAGRAVGNAAAVIGREAGKGLIGLFKKKK